MNDSHDSKKKRWSWDTVTAIAASIIALCALVLTVYQTLETHNHNRLSVRPAVGLTFSQSNFSIVLANDGIGPALIKDISFFVDRERFSLSGKQAYSEWLRFFNKLQLSELCFVFRSIQDGWLAPGEELPLLQHHDRDKSGVCSVNKLGLFEQLDRVEIKIIYESIYKEEFTHREHYP